MISTVLEAIALQEILRLVESLSQKMRFPAGNNFGDKGGAAIVIYLIFAMGFAVLVTLFAIQNAMPVTISFLSWSGNTSFALVIFCSAGAGVLIALLSQVMVQLRLRLSLRQSEKRIHELEKALIEAEILNKTADSGAKSRSDRVLETRGEGL